MYHTQFLLSINRAEETEKWNEYSLILLQWQHKVLRDDETSWSCKADQALFKEEHGGETDAKSESQEM